MKYFSQYDQDKFIDKVVLNKKSNGFFIDIGAYDGVQLSNSYFFEKNRNFKGVCIEPNPVVFEKLNKTRKSVNINACIGHENTEATFLLVKGYGEMLSGLLDYHEEEHKQRIEQTIEKHGGEKKIIKVKVITLESLSLNLPYEIDFCSIDTEGNEFSILETINFDRLNITCFTIENNYQNSEIDVFMRRNKYIKIITLGCDDVYVLKSKLSFQTRIKLLLYKIERKLVNVK